MKFEPAFKFNGDCVEAVAFYARLFGGLEETAVTYGQSPKSLGVPDGWEDKILHSSARVGDLRIMGSDALPGRYVPGTVTTIVISVHSIEEGEGIFESLSNRGQVLFPFKKISSFDSTRMAYNLVISSLTCRPGALVGCRDGCNETKILMTQDKPNKPLLVTVLHLVGIVLCTIGPLYGIMLISSEIRVAIVVMAYSLLSGLILLALREHASEASPDRGSSAGNQQIF